jgi:lysophospholipase L1-like esterase
MAPPLAPRRAAAPALAAAALCAALAAACASDPELVLDPEPAGNAPFMARYVAIGNSITAGYQSGGIGAQTQAEAYPALVARAAGVPYAAPYVVGPGCAPLDDPLGAFRSAVGDPTLVRPGALCARAPESVTDFLNNVAVPGATSASVTGRPGSGGNPLTTLFLGGRTQVERAAEYDPTFVSVWVGNNDVLGAAIAGDTTGATPVAAFQANYDALLAGLAGTRAARERHGLLIGVFDVTSVPAVFPAAVLVTNAGYRSAIEQTFLGGRSLLFIGCPPNTTSLVSVALLLQLSAAVARTPPSQPLPFACEPTPLGGGTVLGTAGILDATEQAALAARVRAYNAYIQQQAVRLGWAYYDPNATYARLRPFPGAFLLAPVFADVPAPFGLALSLDGIHPSAAAHYEIANDVIRAVNARYQTTIPLATDVQALVAGR